MLGRIKLYYCFYLDIKYGLRIGLLQGEQEVHCDHLSQHANFTRLRNSKNCLAH